VELGDILDKSIDDLMDLPKKDPPPNGHYRLQLKGGFKEINNKPKIVFTYKVLEPLELANPADMENLKENVEFDEMFDPFGGNEISEGYFKAAIKPIAEHFKVAQLRDVLSVIQAGIEVFGTVKKTQDKDDKERYYGKVSNIVVA